jgi:uncharacterized RDD family membrane protein YckC
VSAAPQPYPPQHQPPPPPTGTAYANYGTRVLAYLIDSGVDLAVLITFGLIISVIGKVSGVLSTLLSLLLWAAVLAYPPVFDGLWGQTIGKRVMHIRVVGERTGQPIGVGLGVVRYLVLWISTIPLYIGYLSPLFDSTKRLQGWHDKAAGDVVVLGDAANWPEQLAFLKPAATSVLFYGAPGPGMAPPPPAAASPPPPTWAPPPVVESENLQD